MTELKKKLRNPRTKLLKKKQRLKTAKKTLRKKLLKMTRKRRPKKKLRQKMIQLKRKPKTSLSWKNLLRRKRNFEVKRNVGT